MADSTVAITEGAGKNIDTRTESTNSQHRQVVVLGDPALNANVAAVATQDLPGTDQTTPAVVARIAGSITIQQINSSSSIHILSTAGTMAVNVGKTDGTVTVRFDPGYTLGKFDAGLGTFGVNLGKVDGTIQVNVGKISDTIAVWMTGTSGTLGIKLDPGYNVANISSTIVLPRTVSGTANGVSVSGNTVVVAVASRVIKVYAIALTTTAQVGLATRFTNGAGTGPTEFWRYALQAPSQGIAGANLAVSPPSYLFATASGSTLSLVLDSASLVHYSVGYFLESA